MECQNVQALLLDNQLENLSADERTEVEEHLDHCPICNNEVSNLKQNNAARSRKPMITWILFGVVSLIFVMLVINNQAETVGKSIGEDLNISATDNDVKVTITDFITDDYQTVINYQIEDLSEGKYYQMDIKSGLKILFNSKTINYLDSYVYQNDMKENMHHGKIITSPLDIENGIIELQLTKLELTGDEDKLFNLYEDEIIVLEGEWNFEIPVTKHTAIVKELDIEKELGGRTFVFDQLIMAPTSTFLSYQYESDKISDQLVSINFTSMSSGDRVYQRDFFSGNYWYDTEMMNFESMYLDKPDHVLVHIDNYIITTVNVQTEFMIDQTMESQSFDFLGTTLTVDLTKEQETTTLEITEETEANRPYENINYRLIDGQGNAISDPVAYSYYLVDRGDDIYNQDQWEELEEWQEWRVFTLTTQFLLDSEVETDQPIFLQIVDYSKTIFVDEPIRLDLD